MGVAACTTVEKVRFTVSPRTAPTSAHPEGLPATLDGPLSGSVVSGDGTFELDPSDPNAYFLVSGDNPGVTEFDVSGDGRQGPEVKTITEHMTLTVTAADVDTLGSVASAPQPK